MEAHDASPQVTDSTIEHTINTFTGTEDTEAAEKPAKTTEQLISELADLEAENEQSQKDLAEREAQRNLQIRLDAALAKKAELHNRSQAPQTPLSAAETLRTSGTESPMVDSEKPQHLGSEAESGGEEDGYDWKKDIEDAQSIDPWTTTPSSKPKPLPTGQKDPNLKMETGIGPHDEDFDMYKYMAKFMSVEAMISRLDMPAQYLRDLQSVPKILQLCDRKEHRDGIPFTVPYTCKDCNATTETATICGLNSLPLHRGQPRFTCKCGRFFWAGTVLRQTLDKHYNTAPEGHKGAWLSAPLKKNSRLCESLSLISGYAILEHTRRNGGSTSSAPPNPLPVLKRDRASGGGGGGGGGGGKGRGPGNGKSPKRRNDHGPPHTGGQPRKKARQY